MISTIDKGYALLLDSTRLPSIGDLKPTQTRLEPSSHITEKVATYSKMDYVKYIFGISRSAHHL